jgi:alpha-tubulin suppressor-like RCC1 family protein
VVVLASTGAVVSWGRNHYGQLGLGTLEDKLSPRRVELQPVRTVATGDGVSAAINAAGELFVWGRNGSGQLPVKGNAASKRQVLTPTRSAITSRVAAVDAGLRHLVVLTEDGDLLEFGTDSGGITVDHRVTISPGAGRVRSVSAGEDHTLALTTQGVVLAWGANDLGQIGIGEPGRSQVPVTAVELPGARGQVTAIKAGSRHSLALTDRHEVYAWGDGRYGAVGGGRPEIDATTVATPQRVPLPPAVVTKRLCGAGYGSAVLVERGPAVRLELAPGTATVAAGRAVRYRANAVDAFGIDLGPVPEPLTLTAPGATVRGSTVTADEAGTYSVTARAGSLLGRARLHVTKGIAR